MMHTKMAPSMPDMVSTYKELIYDRKQLRKFYPEFHEEWYKALSPWKANLNDVDERIVKCSPMMIMPGEKEGYWCPDGHPMTKKRIDKRKAARNQAKQELEDEHKRCMRTLQVYEIEF